MAILKWLLPTGLAWALVHQLLRWRIDLFVRCVEDADPNLITYTCAIHNAENRDLVVPFALEVTISDSTHGFEADEVSLHTDPIQSPVVLPIARTSGEVKFIIHAEGMRARETWHIRFRTHAGLGNVSLLVRSRETAWGAAYTFPVVQYAELRPRQFGSHSTGTGTSRATTRTIAGLAGASMYLWAVAALDGGWATFWARAPIARLGDMLVAGVLFGAAYIMMRTSWRRSAPFIQGYQEVSRTPSPGAPAAAPATPTPPAMVPAPVPSPLAPPAPGAQCP